MRRPAPARAILLAGLVAVLAGIALLVVLDLDISPHRYLRNDVLLRGASSIEAIYSYPTMDPSPFSIALPANLFVRESLRNAELPLWDRMQGGGYSVVAQGNLGVMFPLRWLTAPLPPHQAQSAFLLLTLYLCFAGALLWLVDLGYEWLRRHERVDHYLAKLRRERVERALDRYGWIAVFAATPLLGVWTMALAAKALGMATRPFLIASTVSVIVYAALITAAIMLGVELVSA